MTSQGGNQGYGAPGELDVEEDLRAASRGWRLQRAAWSVMGLVIVAALLGFFGNGPLSWREAGEPGGPLHLRYERFIHNQAPVVLRLRVGPELADEQGRVRLWVSRGYLEGLKVEQLTPEPELVEAGPDRTVFVLRLAEPSESAEVVARFEAEAIGPLRGVVGVDAPRSARVEFSQFAYP